MKPAALSIGILLAEESRHGLRAEVVIPDPDHSVGERRFLSMGLSSSGRLLVVAYTERQGRIRLINAREATASERKSYEPSTQKD